MEELYFAQSTVKEIRSIWFASNPNFVVWETHPVDTQGVAYK